MALVSNDVESRDQCADHHVSGSPFLKGIDLVGQRAQFREKRLGPTYHQLTQFGGRDATIATDQQRRIEVRLQLMNDLRHRRLSQVERLRSTYQRATLQHLIEHHLLVKLELARNGDRGELHAEPRVTLGCSEQPEPWAVGVREGAIVITIR